MSVYENVNAAFVQKLLQSPLSSYPIWWEGKDITPDYERAFIEYNLLPASLDQLYTIDKVGGVAQVIIHHPLNTGSPLLFEDASLILNFFVPYTILEYSNTKVSIKRRYAGVITKDKDKLSISVFIEWRTVSDRT